MEEDILNYLYQLSCFVGLPVVVSFLECYLLVNTFFSLIIIFYLLFNILFGIKQLHKLWKKTFLTILQLSCFVGHSVA